MTVFEQTRDFLCERCGCFYEDVEMAATFDELNVADFEREELSFLLTERHGVDIPTDALFSFEAIEDLVGYIEDRL